MNTPLDFSPASSRHAKEEAENKGLRCRFIHADVRDEDFGKAQRLPSLCGKAATGESDLPAVVARRPRRSP